VEIFSSTASWEEFLWVVQEEKRCGIVLRIAPKTLEAVD
jgi:hypothetical protein